MKLLIISDIHGDSYALEKVLEREKNNDAIIFLGDGMEQIEDLQAIRPDLKIYSACGNCDRGYYAPSEGLAAFGGLLVFYTHGHGYEVKFSIAPLKRAARLRGADIVLFGHTHSPYYEYSDGLYLFNPGSLGRARIGRPTYGVITIQEKIPRFETKEVY